MSEGGRRNLSVSLVSELHVANRTNVLPSSMGSSMIDIWQGLIAHLDLGLSGGRLHTDIGQGRHRHVNLRVSIDRHGAGESIGLRGPRHRSRLGGWRRVGADSRG